MIHNICDNHSLASVFLAELRENKTQQDRARFRKNMVRLGEIFAYEISKTFNYSPEETETPLGIATSHIPIDKVILATILRAGLPMHHGMLNYLEYANNAFISTFRKHHKDGTFEIHLEYINCPDVTGSVVILIDAMIATGSTMSKTIEAIFENGDPVKIHVVSIIASKDGLEYIERMYPDVEIWIAAEDEELTAKSLIVPGLGDAGDLAFGGKFQEF